MAYPLCEGCQWSSSGPLPSQQCSPLLWFQRTRYPIIYTVCNESKIYESFTFWNKLQEKIYFFTIFFFFLDVPVITSKGFAVQIRPGVRQLVTPALKTRVMTAQTSGASVIKCCTEAFLNLILRSSLKYAYVRFIEWVYAQKMHIHLFSDVKSMNRKLSWTCT